MDSVEIFLRIAGVTVLAFIAIIWLREFGRRSIGLAVALFCFGIASYLLCPPLDRIWQLGVLEIPFFAGCFGAAMFFFLMSRAVFDDQFRFQFWHLGLLAVMETLGAWHRLAGDLPSDAGLQVLSPYFPLVLHQLISLVITLSALFLAFQGRRDDLVEKRRQFRDIFVGICGAYILIVVSAEILLRNNAAHPILELVNVAVIFVISFVFAVNMARLRAIYTTVVPGTVTPVAPPGDAAEEQLLAALVRTMEEQHGYRREGLTIGQLADELTTQEYRLRRLINGRLGYRNFSEFLNKYRLQEVCGRLSDPASVKLPILTIALDSGYSSLGPFNRAFKELLGMTPKDYRQKHLTKAKSLD